MWCKITENSASVVGAKNRMSMTKKVHWLTVSKPLDLDRSRIYRTPQAAYVVPGPQNTVALHNRVDTSPLFVLRASWHTHSTFRVP